MPHYLYILQSEATGRYYTGISGNPERRLHFHNTMERGHTAFFRSWKIVLQKEFPTQAEAHAAEKRVKAWKSRKMIERLLDGELHLLDDD